MTKRSRVPDAVTNVDVAVYALAVLDGAEKRVYSEAVAARCFELDPARFSWRLPEYRNWPDKYVVKTALEDAKKDEYGFLVDGAYNLDPAKDGWRLTPNGALWFRTHSARVAAHFATSSPATTTKDQKRILRDIQKESLFRQFAQTRTMTDVSSYAFTDMLNCSPDASADVIAIKFRRLLSSARMADDHDIIEFLTACAERFSTLMPGWNRRER
jgi:hypothetical protein